MDGGTADSLASDGSLLLSGLTVGEHRVELSGVASNCTVQGENPRSVAVEPADTTETAFEVDCFRRTGAVRVEASTSGAEIDADGYVVEADTAVDGTATSGSTPMTDTVAANGSVLLDGLPEGGVISGTPTSDDSDATFRVTEDGDVFAEGDTIRFRGSASDPEGTSLARVEWFRSESGDPDSVSFGTGENIDRADLPVGEQEVWLVAEADDGLVGISPRVSIEVSDASAGYQLEIRGRNSPPARVLREARDAAARWERIVTGAEEEVALDAAAQDCHPAVDEVIDDAVAYVQVDSIDGPGNTLAQAGPRFLRSQAETTILGCVEVDEADLRDALSTDDALQTVLEHELAHVLGFPALWNGESTERDLLSGSGTSDPRFTGDRAASAYDSIGGSSSTSVPLEPGDEAHWPENEFGDEILTPALRIGAESPLSAVTAATFGDMEMTVDVSAADDFTLDGTSDVAADRTGQPGRILRLGDDLLPGVVRVVDLRGRVIRVFRIPPRPSGGRP